MSRTTTLASLFALIFWIGSGGNTNAERKADFDQLKVGSHCELQTKVTEDGRSWTTYLGTVNELTEKSVILSDVTVTHRSDKTPRVVFQERWCRTQPYLR